MSDYTQFYVDFFTKWHETDKKYGIVREEGETEAMSVSGDLREIHEDDTVPESPYEAIMVYPETHKEVQAAWNKVDAFLSEGFIQGENIWWCYRGTHYYKAVYLCKRDDSAGIAILDVGRESWVPAEVSFEFISARFDD